MLSNAAAAAAAATPLLRLQSFSINYLVTPGVLYALPAASLTRLELRLVSSTPYTAAAPANGSHAAALARLASLQHLELAIGDRSENQLGVFSSMLPAVGQLSRLTHLQVIKYCWEHAAPDMASQALRKLLQEPCKEWQQQLQVLQLSLTEGTAIDLSGASGLQRLQLGAYGLPSHRMQLQEGWVLPKQLQQLNIAGCLIATPAALGIQDMQQLQQLTLLAQFTVADGQQALLQLAQLPCLQQLTLQYADAAAVAGTADVWQQLPALVSLDLEDVGQMTEAVFTSTLQVRSTWHCGVYGCIAGHVM
jgi:hypothetical protein